MIKIKDRWGVYLINLHQLEAAAIVAVNDRSLGIEMRMLSGGNMVLEFRSLEERDEAWDMILKSIEYLKI